MINFPINIPVGSQLDGMPIYHKEGNWDSAVDTLPTGAAAADLASGSWAVDDNPDKLGEVSLYNARTDTWNVCFTLSSS